MRFLLLTLAALLSPASAQPVLAPEAALAYIGRSETAGLLSDSTAARLGACAAAGAPITKATLVRSIRDDVCQTRGWPGCGPFGVGMYQIDPEVVFPRTVWVDSLAAAGLLTEAERDEIGARVREIFPDSFRLPPPVAGQQFDVIAGLLEARALVSPDWLGDQAGHWVEEGLLSTESRRRLIAAAESGALEFPQQALAFLDVAVALPVDPGERYRRREAVDLDTLALVTEAAVGLLRERGVADLDVTGLRLDSRRAWSYNPYETDPDHLGGRATVPVLEARVDGEPYRQQIGGYGWAPLDLLNRVLRDRGRVHRLFTTRVAGPSLEARLAVLVLTPGQRGVLDPQSTGALSPPQRAVLDAVRSVDDAPACRDLVFSVMRFLVTEVDLDGPRRQPRENLLTTGALTTAFDRLGAVGLLDHLGAEERAAVRASLTERYLSRVEDVLEAVPDLVFGFDWEGAYPPRPYADLFERFAAVSRGAFAPTDITDTFESYAADSVDVGFTARGRRYETRLPVDGDWLQGGFLDLVWAAVDTSGGQFYRLGPYAEDGFIFLTPPQRQALIDLGLFPIDAAPVPEE